MLCVVSVVFVVCSLCVVVCSLCVGVCRCLLVSVFGRCRCLSVSVFVGVGVCRCRCVCGVVVVFSSLSFMHIFAMKYAHTQFEVVRPWLFSCGILIVSCSHSSVHICSVRRLVHVNSVQAMSVRKSSC